MGLLVVLSYLFRLPRLINPSALHSDAAIVGLQARHMLAGEWSPFLYGSSYQTSVDSAVAALWFLVLGPGPSPLILSTLTDHVILTLCVFGVLQRRIERWSALLCTLPLVFTPSAVHTYVLSPPRQAALTLVFVSVWLIDGAIGSKRWRLRLAAGSWLASFAVFADPYALLLAPVALLIGLLACRDDRASLRAWLSRAAVLLAGFALGLLPYAWLVSKPSHDGFYAHFETSLIAHNAALLWHECLPWLLGLKVFLAYPDHAHEPWIASMPFRLVQLFGAASFLGAIVAGGALALRKHADWRLARLGIAGAVALPLTIAAFLTSKMIFDLFATRYLVAIVLFAPFALAPLAARLGTRRFALIIAPYLMTAAAGGWVAFGDETSGPWPVHAPDGSARDELRMADALAARGVRAGIADYWTDYRFVFLTGERVLLTPWHEKQDRYRPYRDALLHANRFAYVFDETRSWEDFASSQRELESKATVTGRIDVGQLHAVVYEGSVPDGF